jgi:hypothetical protein
MPHPSVAKERSEMSASTSRRALLARAGIAAGIAGAGAVGLKAGATPTVASPGRPLPRVVHGRDWRIVFAGLDHGAVPGPATPRLPQGRLVDGDGAHLGLLESSLLPSTGGVTHLHRLDLDDGGLIAVGPGGDDATFTIVGGTGRYLGASGTYHAAQRPRAHGGDGTATFTFDITTPEA